MPEKNHVFATLGAENYYTQILGNNHTFYVDEPIEAGGGNKSPHPTAYLLAALTSCTAITIRMYAQRKGWDVGKIKVAARKVEKITDQGKSAKIIKQVTFENKLTDEQTKRLYLVQGPGQPA